MSRAIRKVPPRVRLSAVESVLPVNVRSLYRAVLRGRRPTWLSHSSPEGLDSRAWWVDVPGMLAHYRVRGIELPLEVDQKK